MWDFLSLVSNPSRGRYDGPHISSLSKNSMVKVEPKKSEVETRGKKGKENVVSSKGVPKMRTKREVDEILNWLFPKGSRAPNSRKGNDDIRDVSIIVKRMLIKNQYRDHGQGNHQLTAGK